MTDEECKAYLKADAAVDLLLFSANVDDLLADLDAGRLTLRTLREDDRLRAHLRAVVVDGRRLMAALEHLALDGDYHEV